MAEGYVDEHGLIRWGEEHDLEDLALPPQRVPGDEDEDDADDGDDEGEGDDD